MGSWNGTCALTHLPIHSSDRVVVHIIASHKFGWNADFGGGFVSANTHAHPLGPALRGTYNDYGGVTNLEGAALNWWEAHLEELKPHLTDRLGCYGGDELMEFASMDDFINGDEGVERGEVFFGPRKEHRMEDFRAQHRLGLMLIHEAAYDRFMAAGINSDDWMIDGDVLVYYTQDLKKRLTALAKYKGDVPRSYRRDDPYGRLGLDGDLVMKSVQRYAKAHKDKALVEEVARLRIFDMLLEAARKLWGVQCGAGSTYSDTHLQVALARFTLEYAGETA